MNQFKKRLFILSVLTILFHECSAQIFQAGIIDYYGINSARPSYIKCLPFQKNDTLTFLLDSVKRIEIKKEIVGCLLKLPGVKLADISFVCCDGAEGKLITFVGTSDQPKTSNSFKKRSKLRLPIEMVNSYDSLMNLLYEMVSSGNSQEDDSEGHALFKFPPARKIQERFKIYAVNHLATLKKVIRKSKYTHDREVAATIIAYHPDKKLVVKDLLMGVNDDNEGVRNDVIRALGIIANYALTRPELKITISPEPFIRLMNSISWTDRNKAGFVLLALTEDRNQVILSKLKTESINSITDMALWQSEGHAIPGFILLGRIAGLTNEEISDASKENREKTVAIILDAIHNSHLR